VLPEYQKAPQVTRDRLYTEAMQQVYGSVTKVLAESRQGGSLLYLPLDRLMQGAAEPPATANTAAPAASGNPVPPAAAGGADGRTRDNGRSREREVR
jgi:membrane protease subunit HflK